MNNDDTIIKTDEVNIEVEATEEATVKTAEEIAAAKATIQKGDGHGRRPFEFLIFL